MKRRMLRNAAIGVLISFSLLIAAAVFTKRHALACEFLPLMGYAQLNSQLFIAPDGSPSQFEDVLNLFSSAGRRIGDVYGQPDSKPIFLITVDAETARRWGANETASMHRLPWGSCVIIGPEGLNVDVIAHEWLHAEIQHRLGFWNFLKEMPVWFDEGAALTLDYREPFIPGNIELSDQKINEIQHRVNGQDFFSGDIRENYQAARMAVDPLITKETFFQDLQRIADGEAFDVVFLRANERWQR